MKFLRRLGPFVVLAMTLAACGVVWANRNAVGDWFALRGYAPSDTIATLADETTMTPLARKLFYVNHPELQGRDAFNKHCTNEREQIVVLGCFVGNRQGIYLFDVQSDELHGVEQVTAAHEMLHQAYERLSTAERERIDGLLKAYAATVTDEALREQLAAYQKSEPDAVVNEMHSLFGTQVADLPPALESYYKQYFTRRAAIVEYYTAYRGAFTQRQAQVKAYDEQIAAHKSSIEAAQDQLESQLREIHSKQSQMTTSQGRGDIAAYNRQVPLYNALVDAYNAGLAKVKAEIDVYNDLIAKRNAIVVQEQQLQQDLSSKQLPSLSGQ